MFAHLVAGTRVSFVRMSLIWSPPVTVTEETTVYYLVTHGREDNALLIFLGSNPNLDNDTGIAATPVTLELLPPRQRFGGVGGVAMGKPALGRWPSGVARFRQFLTFTELEQAGWVPVERYRICDTLEDFYSPWAFTEEDQSTKPSSIDHLAGDDTDS
jgi:hypothetical protein